MIVPMKKLTLLVLNSEREQALKSLRKLGLVHVEKKEASSELLAELNQVKSDIELCENLMSEAMPKSVKKQKKPTPVLNEEDSLNVVKEMIELNGKRTQLNAVISNLQLALEKYLPWGDFNLSDIKFLLEKGVFLYPAVIEKKKYANISDDLNTLRVKSIGKQVYFLIVSSDENLPADLDSSISIVDMPDKSVADLRDDYLTSVEELKNTNTRMSELSKYLNSVKALNKLHSKKIEFEDIRAGMQDIVLNKENKDISDIGLAWLTGYIPVADSQKIESVAKDNGWAYIFEDPTEEDAVPTKLKNNKVVSIINPLFNFLDTTPGYFEADVSSFFLLFFGVFVAMIFGDAAYGGLITLTILFAMFKKKISGQKIGPSLWFFLYLSTLMTLWGVMICSWFGISPENLPDYLKGFAIEGISSLVPANVRNKNIMFLSFIIGSIHLIIAHLIAISRSLKTPKFLGDIGSIFMLIGMFFVILNMIIDSEKYPLNNFVFGSLGIGFVLNFLFSNYETSLGQSLMESCKNFINMFLGVVNVFSDIMSYIRLWAVGMAGATISMTVNSIMGPMLGKGMLIAVGIAIFAFGHGLNIMMAVLSVLVHAVRLNAMEFSSHLGLTWSGFKYKPFSETVE